MSQPTPAPLTRAILERVYLEDVKTPETLGSWWYKGKLLCKTMELPWRKNSHNISCIPEGVYLVKKERFTEKHAYPHFRISGTEPREGILVHRITYVKDLRGCIGVGARFEDHNGDGAPDIAASTDALFFLYNTMPDTFELEIRKQVVKPV